MNLHLKMYSYRDEDELKFKCEDCEFWGPNNLTMEKPTLQIMNVECVTLLQNHWRVWKLTYLHVRSINATIATSE